MASSEGGVAHTDGLKFLGIARVDLSNLDFSHAGLSTHRPVSDRNVARLVQIFHIEGCKRLENDQHCIDGLIDVGHLSEVRIESLTKRLPADLCTIPLIDVPIRCIHGLHRKLAAEKYLDENDQWWPVRIYSEVDQHVHTATLESYANELCYNDGEIFRNIRRYNIAGDKGSENKWWARLTMTKRKDLRQLLKDERYVKAFDDLLPWPGLWYAIKLGSLHRLLTMKCDEEIICYLQHVATSWRRIVGDASCTVDIHTVQAIEGLAPAMSLRDGASVRCAMELRRAFPDVGDSMQRQQLQNNILAIATLIPSLHTFFECLKFLEPCAKIMRGLLPLRPKRSIRQSLWGSYFEPSDNKVQHAEGEMRPRQSSSSVQENRSAAYIQLWLFALRHFPDLTNTTPRKDTDKVKPAATEPNPIIWQRFGDLACSLGFRTAAAQRLRDSDAVRQLAISVSKQCTFDDNNGDQLITSLTELLTLGPGPSRCVTPMLVGSAETLMERRFGRPFQADHLADKPRLFLPHLYNHANGPDYDITTFFCKRDMLVHFLDIKDTSLPTHFSDVAQPPTAGPNGNPCAPDHSACSNCAMLQNQIADAQRQRSALEAQLVDCRSANQDLQSQLASAEERFIREQDLAVQSVREKMTEVLERERNEAQKQHETTLRELEAVRAEAREQAVTIDGLEDQKFDANMKIQNDSAQHATQIKIIQGAHQTELKQICENWNREHHTHAEGDKQLKLRVYLSNSTKQRLNDLWFNESHLEEVVTTYNLLSPSMRSDHLYYLSHTEAHVGKLLGVQDLDAFADDPVHFAKVWREHKVLLLTRRIDDALTKAYLQSEAGKKVRTQSHARTDRPHGVKKSARLVEKSTRKDRKARNDDPSSNDRTSARLITYPRPEASSVPSPQDMMDVSTASGGINSSELIVRSEQGPLTVQSKDNMDIDLDGDL